MYLLLSIIVIFSINFIDEIRAEDEVKEYRVFDCTQENRDEHFDKIEKYIDETIPQLEAIKPETLDEKHKELLPKLIEHFKCYKTDKQNLKTACNTITLEECCNNITLLENEFNDDLHKWHQESGQAQMPDWLLEYRFFNCTKENKDQHFDNIERYMNQTLPQLEAIKPETLDEKQKELLPKVIEHYKSYKTDKQNLKNECDTSPLEECCQKITTLETKFHDDIGELQQAKIVQLINGVAKNVKKITTNFQKMFSS